MVATDRTKRRDERWKLALGILCMAGCAAEAHAPERSEQTARNEAGLATGHFVGSTVAGLRYESESGSGTTDDAGRFSYREGEQVRFSVGELPLGATLGKASVTVRDLVPAARDESDPAVSNRLVLLQTLDQDGDLNTGIAIGAEAARIVGTYRDGIDFAQSAAAFAADADVVKLLAALNAAAVFTDVDPRPRTLRSERAAREHFVRATSERFVVTTRQGQLSGYAPNPTTRQWLGVRYAQPPIGALRWKPPVELAAWTGVRDAVAWGDQAPQNPRFESNGEGGMSEDCLTVNVTAPANARDLPVMVWFHGGAFTILTSNSRAYNNVDGPTTEGVVLVTVNHRLGPFGYLAHPWLAADASYGGSGNYGQMDLVQALKWVKENIASFGGDPANLTIFGQSGGGGKVGSLLNSPLAAGLFQKAVIQSGQNAIPQTGAASVIAAAEEVGKAMFGRLGVQSLAEARALPWTAIVQSDIDANIPREIYRPSIDNYYMSKTFYDTVRDGQPSEVPLLIGATNGDYPSLRAGLTEVVPFRAAHSKAPLYVYKFDRVPAGWAPTGLLSGHGGELPYLFNYPPMYVSNYLLDLVLDPATGKRAEIGDLNGDGITGTAGDVADVTASMGWNDDDARIADQLLEVWTNFAKTGNPSTSTLAFPAYTAETDQYVEFGQGATAVKSGLATAFQ